jgi:hypothetical protein
MTYPPFGPIDAIKMVRRYAAGPSRLGRALGVSVSLIHTNIREFKRLSLFPNGFHPLRESDHYKAAILYTVCRIQRPRFVVETGVASGISTTGILAALAQNSFGTLYSIDLPGATYTTDTGESWKDLARQSGPGWMIPPQLKGRWVLRVGDSRSILPQVLAELSEVDLFYHDSEHTEENMTFELNTTVRHLASRGTLVVDNTNWSNAVGRFVARTGFRSTDLYPFLSVVRPG